MQDIPSLFGGPKVGPHGRENKKKPLPKQRFSSFPTWSGRLDSNQRPPTPEAGALTGLRYTPNFFGALIVLRAHKDKPKNRKHQIISEKNIISSLFGRYLLRCPPSRHHFAELPIQVHLCQIHSSGPCLCRLSHHLQQAICSTSIAMPMSRLTVCPQRVASPSPNG